MPFFGVLCATASKRLFLTVTSIDNLEQLSSAVDGIVKIEDVALDALPDFEDPVV